MMPPDRTIRSEPSSLSTFRNSPTDLFRGKLTQVLAILASGSPVGRIPQAIRYAPIASGEQSGMLTGESILTADVLEEGGSISKADFPAASMLAAYKAKDKGSNGPGRYDRNPVSVEWIESRLSHDTALVQQLKPPLLKRTIGNGSGSFLRSAEEEPGERNRTDTVCTGRYRDREVRLLRSKPAPVSTAAASPAILPGSGTFAEDTVRAL